jgi:hypothetical protein
MYTELILFSIVSFLNRYNIYFIKKNKSERYDYLFPFYIFRN